MTNNKNKYRKHMTVSIVDGTKLTKLNFKSGELESANEQDYDTELATLQAATPRYGASKRTRLVWCGQATARVARSVKPSEHPEAKKLADAGYLAKVFGEDYFVAMSGSIALSPDAQPEILEHLNDTNPKMVLSGMCVGDDQDGIWLRVGRRNVEATLQHQGKISGWMILCDGLDTVAEIIQKGTDPVVARSKLADQIVSETRMAIMQWQRTRTVPPQIWLHGPGGEPSGEIHQTLLLHSGCRVAPPNIKTPTQIELSQFTTLLPTAKHALNAPLLQQPRAVLQESSRTKRFKLIVAVAIAAVFMGTTAFISNFLGNKNQERLDKLRKEAQTLQQHLDKSASQENLETAKNIQAVFDALSGEHSPNWNMLFRLGERFLSEDGTFEVSSDRQSTSVTTISDNGLAGIETIMKELDEWAKVIYGKDAYAIGGSNTEGPDLKVHISAHLGLHETR